MRTSELRYQSVVCGCETTDVDSTTVSLWSADPQVGLCAISSAKTMFKTVFATDLSPARLEQAKKHGAIALPSSELKQAVLDATDGRGADTALEVVGNEAALMLGFDLLRPFGSLSCVGMQMKPVTFFGPDLYSKK